MIFNFLLNLQGLITDLIGCAHEAMERANDGREVIKLARLFFRCVSVKVAAFSVTCVRMPAYIVDTMHALLVVRLASR